MKQRAMTPFGTLSGAPTAVARGAMDKSFMKLFTGMETPNMQKGKLTIPTEYFKWRGKYLINQGTDEFITSAEVHTLIPELPEPTKAMKQEMQHNRKESRKP